MVIREEYWQDTTNIWQANWIDSYTDSTLSLSEVSQWKNTKK